MKKLTLITLALLLVLTLTACLPSDFENANDTPDENLPAPQTKEELYSLYNELERDMTKAEIEDAFGEGEPRHDDFGDVMYVNYYNDTKSAGVSVIYDENDIIKTKMLFFNKKENLVPFSGRFDEDKIPDVKSDMTVEEVLNVMGSTPLELSCTYNDGGPLDTAKIYCWYNENTSNLMLHTENGVINNIAFYHE